MRNLKVGIKILSSIFHLCVLDGLFDDLKEEEDIYRQGLKKALNLAQKELEKTIIAKQHLFDIDSEAMVQFINSYDELGKLMAEITPEIKMQIIELIKIQKTEPVRFASLANAYGLKII